MSQNVFGLDPAFMYIGPSSGQLTVTVSEFNRLALTAAGRLDLLAGELRDQSHAVLLDPASTQFAVGDLVDADSTVVDFASSRRKTKQCSRVRSADSPPADCAVVGGEEVLDDHLFVWNTLKVGAPHRPICVDAEDWFGTRGVQLEVGVQKLF